MLTAPFFTHHSAFRCWLFGARKSSWTVYKFKIVHMGLSVTKETFAGVFNAAWTGAVKMFTIVNLFARAGIYPID